MQYKTKFIQRKSTTVNTGTFGFDDYEIEYEDKERFFQRVNSIMDELFEQNCQNIQVQYINNPDTNNLFVAIITYQETVN